MAQQRTKAGNTASSGRASESSSTLLFGKRNYIYLGAGVLLIFIGFLLMSGGQMPSPDVWDESIIYSFRRITLAPIVILAGLVICGVSIFIKK